MASSIFEMHAEIRVKEIRCQAVQWLLEDKELKSPLPPPRLSLHYFTTVCWYYGFLSIVLSAYEDTCVNHGQIQLPGLKDQ